MKLEIVDTEGFWRAMCDTRFVRLHMHQGAICDTLYFTDQPPEKVHGFIESKMDEVVNALKLKPPHPFRFWPWTVRGT